MPRTVAHSIHRRLVARGLVRQAETSARADVAARAVNRAIGGVWHALLAVLRDARSPAEAHLRTLAALAGLPAAVAQALDRHAQRAAAWGHETAARVVRAEVPTAWLRPGLLREDDTPAPIIPADLIIPAPPKAAVDAIVYAPVAGVPWHERVRHTTDGVDPRRLADIVSSGYAQGKSQRDIAKDLLPAFDGLKGARVRATRLARTEVLRISHAMQHQVWEGLGDVVAGYQIHATPNPHTRHWHQQRSGTVYLKQPGPGQKGLHQLPHPPLEADDPAERPPGTPQTAWNCLCFTTVILREPPAMVTSAPRMAALAAQTAVPPDPAVMSDWFDRQPEPMRREAAGARRYETARRVLGRPPEWSELVTHDTGELLPPAKLAAEAPAARAERVAKVQAGIDAQRDQLRRVATFGFEPPEPPEPARPSLGVRFRRHELSGRDEVLVFVDPRRLDPVWRATDPGAYLPPGRLGLSEVPGRRAGFAAWLGLNAGKAVQAPRIFLTADGGVGFGDGRSRFATLRDAGAGRVGVMVRREDAAAVRERFGA